MQVAYNLIDISTQFKQAMFDAGIVTDEIPIADGKLHRLKIDGDKNGSTSGMYYIVIIIRLEVFGLLSWILKKHGH